MSEQPYCPGDWVVWTGGLSAERVMRCYQDRAGAWWVVTDECGALQAYYYRPATPDEVARACMVADQTTT